MIDRWKAVNPVVRVLTYMIAGTVIGLVLRAVA